MYQIRIKNEHMNDMYFDDLHKGKNQFISQTNEYTALLNEDEFNKFMRTNNIVPYRDQLKHYESGEIIGSIES